MSGRPTGAFLAFTAGRSGPCGRSGAQLRLPRDWSQASPRGPRPVRACHHPNRAGPRPAPATAFPPVPPLPTLSPPAPSPGPPRFHECDTLMKRISRVSHSMNFRIDRTVPIDRGKREERSGWLAALPGDGGLRSMRGRASGWPVRPGLLYRRRNAAPSAEVLVLHMLSAMLTVTPGATISSMQSSRSLDRLMSSAAR